MAIYPDADTSRILPGFTTKMRGYRGVVLHVAVSESRFPSYGPGLGAHFYVRKDGSVAQQVDTAYSGGHAKQGNSTLIGIETQGGMVDAQGERWTPAQEASLKKLLKWISQTHGIPMTPMRDSRPTSRGIGYHRLGVDPWRVPGGEVWSSSYGKICPGDAKIAQVSGIVTGAPSAPVEEDDMFENADRAKLDKTAYAIDNIILPALTTVATRVWKLSQDAGADQVDEDKIAALILAGLTPDKIAALVPEALAKSVVDEITKRMAA